MKEIQLTQGQKTLVSKEDYESLSKYKWHAYKTKGGSFYATRSVYDSTNQGNGCVYMHRQILGLTNGGVVDHKNRNTLDNRRENIRICTSTQNNGNRRGTSMSGYKGVTFSKAQKMWQAQIMQNRKNIFLGYFKDKVDAAKRYNMAATSYFGEFAYLNVV